MSVGGLSKHMFVSVFVLGKVFIYYICTTKLVSVRFSLEFVFDLFLLLRQKYVLDVRVVKSINLYFRF